MYIQREIEKLPEHYTYKNHTIGTRIPVGADLEYADEIT
jgi:recombinational DNA repair protein RecR